MLSGIIYRDIRVLTGIILKTIINMSNGKLINSFVLLFFTAMISKGQNAEVVVAGRQPVKPKLIVGIVVDQMRYDYLFRFADNYSEGGFKRLMAEGYLFEDANYNYIPTYTGPGHACVYTGTTPAVNGIVDNDWYDRDLRKNVYCAEDTTVKP